MSRATLLSRLPAVMPIDLLWAPYVASLLFTLSLLALASLRPAARRRHESRIDEVIVRIDKHKAECQALITNHAEATEDLRLSIEELKELLATESVTSQMGRNVNGAAASLWGAGHLVGQLAKLGLNGFDDGLVGDAAAFAGKETSSYGRSRPLFNEHSKYPVERAQARVARIELTLERLIQRQIWRTEAVRTLEDRVVEMTDQSPYRSLFLASVGSGMAILTLYVTAQVWGPEVVSMVSDQIREMRSR